MSESNPPLPSDAPFPPTSRKQWEEEAGAQLRGGSLTKLQRTLVDGTVIAPLYHREDLIDHPLRDGVPGKAPFHRGFAPAGCGVAGWGIASSLSCSSANELGILLKEEVEQGATALRISLDPSGKRGSDTVEKTGSEPGSFGVPIRTAEELRQALEGISLPHITLLLDGGAASPAALSLFLASLDDATLTTPLDLHTLWDPLQADISTEYARSGVSVTEQLTLLSEALAWFTDHDTRKSPAPNALPPSATIRPRVLGIDTTFIAEAGGGPVHELLWLGGALIEYLRSFESSGHSPHDIVAHAGAQLSAGPQFFVTTALFRAARIIVGTILREYGLDPATEHFPLHALCLSRPLSLLDLHTNSLRITAEVFGATMGGATTITAIPFDAIGGAPSSRGRRLARNTQLILRDEAQLNHVIDPAGGSWYLESLTEQLATKAWRLIQEIEGRGGIRRAVSEGFVQQLVSEAATRGEQEITSRRSVLVGVNQYPLPGETLSVFHAENTAITSLVGEESPSPISTAPTDTSRSPFTQWIERAREGATLGALMASARTAPPLPTPLLSPRRDALPFETLRAQVTALSVRPRVTICAIGDAAALRARIDFCRDLLGLSGVFIEAPVPVATLTEALGAFSPPFPHAVVLCAPDASYPELVAPFIRQLAERISQHTTIPVVLAGQPGEHEQAFRSAGVYSFMHLRANPIEILTGLIDTIRSAGSSSEQRPNA